MHNKGFSIESVMNSAAGSLIMEQEGAHPGDAWRRSHAGKELERTPVRPAPSPDLLNRSSRRGSRFAGELDYYIARLLRDQSAAFFLFLDNCRFQAPNLFIEWN